MAFEIQTQSNRSQAASGTISSNSPARISSATFYIASLNIMGSGLALLHTEKVAIDRKPPSSNSFSLESGSHLRHIGRYPTLEHSATAHTTHSSTPLERTGSGLAIMHFKLECSQAPESDSQAVTLPSLPVNDTLEMRTRSFSYYATHP